MSDSLEFRADFSAAMPMEKKILWRLVDGQLVQAERPVTPLDELMQNNCVDAGSYFAYLSGLSDIFEEEVEFNGHKSMRDKLILEFTILRSNKWGGAWINQFYTIPKNWGDERSALRAVVGALLGHDIQDGEGFSFKHFVRQPSEVIITVEQKRTVDGKRIYAKIKKVESAVRNVVDDTVPVAPMTQGVPVAVPQYPQQVYAAPQPLPQQAQVQALPQQHPAGVVQMPGFANHLPAPVPFVPPAVSNPGAYQAPPVDAPVVQPARTMDQIDQQYQEAPVAAGVAAAADEIPF